MGFTIKIFDGDYVREHINSHLSFSPKDIIENSKIIASLCSKNRSVADIIFVPVITPFNQSRDFLKQQLEPGFHLIYIKTDLDSVVSRDVKGLYARALKGEILNFIGIDPKVPFESPTFKNLEIDTSRLSVRESSKKLNNYIFKIMKKRI